MEHEFEAAAADSIGDVLNESHPVDSGEPCRNCGTVVPDRYCTQCGQLASNFHRPFWSLATSALTDTFSLDGRLSRTLPALLFFPGRMTRNYLAGQRARYVPPVRLFLLTSIICFFSFFATSDNMGWFDDIQIGPGPGQEVVIANEGNEVRVEVLHSPDEIAEALADPELSEEEKAKWTQRAADLETYKDAPRLLLPDGTVNREAIDDYINAIDDESMDDASRESARRALNRSAHVYENAGRAGQLIRAWLPRIAVLFAPILALFLGLSYIWRRKFYTYDHLIVAMHYQSFLFIWSVIFLYIGLFMPVLHDWAVVLMAVVPIIYLYRLLREVYQRSRLTTGIRVFALFHVIPFIFAMLSLILTTIVYYTA